VVVEAAECSGSLITARLADEQGAGGICRPGEPARSACGRDEQSPEAGGPASSPARGTWSRLWRPSWDGRSSPLGREFAGPDEGQTPEPLPDIVQRERERVVRALGRAPLISTRSSASRDWAPARSISCCSNLISREDCSVTASNSSRWSRPRTDLTPSEIWRFAPLLWPWRGDRPQR
jgi:hypothetical protein